MLAPGASVALRVPASSANLGPGFDSVGLALGLWDEARAEVVAEPGLVVEVSGQGAQEVPRDSSHLVVRAMHATWEHLGVPAPAGLRLVARNGVPHGRGLGSSATAIVMGAALAHALAVRSGLGEGLGGASDGVVAGTVPDAASGDHDFGVDLDLVNQVASGLEGHPDNASASVYGGATLSITGEVPEGSPWPRTRTIRLHLHPAITPIVLVPRTTLSTSTARAVLPPSVPLRTAAASTARGGVLVHALTTDPGWLLEGTTDLLHQEPRRASYPASMGLLDRLRAAGHAAAISGAGPGVLVLTADPDPEAVAAEVTTLAGATGEDWRVLRPGVPATGVHPLP